MSSFNASLFIAATKFRFDLVIPFCDIDAMLEFAIFKVLALKLLHDAK